MDRYINMAVRKFGQSYHKDHNPASTDNVTIFATTTTTFNH